MLEEAARAKVNLFLHVVGRRPDGYHLLDSLVAFPPVGDVVRAEVSQALTLTLEGPFGAGLAAEADNLVLRAARALAHGTGAALTLEKNLPVSSGIGGGSADAAATLRVLSRLWDVAVPHGLAAGLGADVPVCMASQPARMGGIGEILGPVPPLPPAGIVLVNPGVAVSTPAVFRARAGGFSAMAALPDGWADAAALVATLAGLGNDLEAPALSLCSEIGAVLGWLRARDGCLLARMSGSGATCFGLFGTAGAAAEVARSAPPGWWAWGGELSSTPD